MTNNKSFAVIGGGISGIYTAYQLKKIFPTSKIDIYEKSDSTGGATRDKCLYDEVIGKELILPNGTHYTGSGEIGTLLNENKVDLLLTKMEEYSANIDNNGNIEIIKGTSSPKLAEPENNASGHSFKRGFSEKLLPLCLENYLKLIWGDRVEGLIANLEKKSKIKFSELSALSKYTFLLTKFTGKIVPEQTIYNSVQSLHLDTPKQNPLSVYIPRIGWSKSLDYVTDMLKARGINIHLSRNISLKNCEKIDQNYHLNNTIYSNIVWRGDPNEIIRLASQKYIRPIGWKTPKRFITHCITHDIERFKPGAYLMDYTDRGSIMRIHRTPYETELSVLTIESFFALKDSDYTHLKNIMGIFTSKSVSIRTINEYSFNDFSIIPLGYEVTYAQSAKHCNTSHPNLLVAPGIIYGKEQIAKQMKLIINNIA